MSFEKFWRGPVQDKLITDVWVRRTDKGKWTAVGQLLKVPLFTPLYTIDASA